MAIKTSNIRDCVPQNLSKSQPTAYSFMSLAIIVVLMTEAASTSEMSMNFYHTTQLNPQDNHFLLRFVPSNSYCILQCYPARSDTNPGCSYALTSRRKGDTAEGLLAVCAASLSYREFSW
jgi:hypothetical protein